VGPNYRAVVGGLESEKLGPGLLHVTKNAPPLRGTNAGATKGNREILEGRQLERRLHQASPRASRDTLCGDSGCVYGRVGLLHLHLSATVAWPMTAPAWVEVFCASQILRTSKIF
jgi:hypothetical protein